MLSVFALLMGYEAMGQTLGDWNTPRALTLKGWYCTDPKITGKKNACVLLEKPTKYWEVERGFGPVVNDVHEDNRYGDKNPIQTLNETSELETRLPSEVEAHFKLVKPNPISPGVVWEKLFVFVQRVPYYNNSRPHEVFIILSTDWWQSHGAYTTRIYWSKRGWRKTSYLIENIKLGDPNSARVEITRSLISISKLPLALSQILTCIDSDTARDQRRWEITNFIKANCKPTARRLNPLVNPFPTIPSRGQRPPGVPVG